MVQSSRGAQGQGQWKTVTVPKEFDEILDRLKGCEQWPDLPVRELTPAMWDVLCLDEGFDNLTAVNAYICAHGWTAATTPWMLVGDRGWFKGDTLVITGKAGVLAYRLQGRA